MQEEGLIRKNVHTPCDNIFYVSDIDDSFSIEFE